MTKRVTSFDVAKRAGVSRSVVSAVLNHTPGIGVSEEKRRAVLAAIEELNYVVDMQAQGMRTGKSRCIAAYGDLSNLLFTQMLQGLQRACNELGYVLLLLGADAAAGSRDALIEMYLQRRIDGIVTKDTTGYADPVWQERIVGSGIPYVSVEGFPESEEITSVLMDYPRSVDAALDYIQSKGAGPPVYIEVYEGGTHRPNWGDRQRTLTYRQWMKRHGLTPRTELRSVDPWPEDKDWWNALVATETAAGEACFLTNWSRGAVRLYRAAHELRLDVGRELRVMALDNTERLNAHLIPSLTAIEVPYAEMGEAAGRRLIAMIEGESGAAARGDMWVEARLMARESL